MKGIKKYLIWFLMYTKRLLKKPAFLILLLLIPTFLPLISVMMKGESGILTIALVNENKNETAEKIIGKLTDKESIINYKICNTKDEAVQMVKNKTADGAWIFAKNIREKTDKYAVSKIPFVEVIEREENISLKISRELLYGALYNGISYSLYKNYVYENILPKDQISEEELEYYYYVSVNTEGIVEIKKLDSEEKTQSSNLLVTPVRGILSLMVIICQLAAVMFYLKDRSEGKFDWLSENKRIIPAFGSLLSAGLLAGITAVISFFVSKMSLKPDKEIISMLLFILASTGFSLVLCCVFKSPAKLGAAVPGIIIIMLALSPVFFSFKELRLVRILIPTHYYLYSLYNQDYYLYFIYYTASVYLLAFLLNVFLRKRRETKIL